MRTKPSFSVSISDAKIGAEKLGSSSLTERYSRPALDVRFQAAPNSFPPADEDAEVGGIVVSLFGLRDAGLHAQRDCFQRTRIALIQFGEAADDHDGLLCLGRAHRGLDGASQAERRSQRT